MSGFFEVEKSRRVVEFVSVSTGEGWLRGLGLG